MSQMFHKCSDKRRAHLGNYYKRCEKGLYVSPYICFYTLVASEEDIILMFKFLLATSKKILKNNWVASLVDAPPLTSLGTLAHHPSAQSVNVLVWHLNRAAFMRTQFCALITSSGSGPRNCTRTRAGQKRCSGPAYSFKDTFAATLSASSGLIEDAAGPHDWCLSAGDWTECQTKSCHQASDNQSAGSPFFPVVSESTVSDAR